MKDKFIEKLKQTDHFIILITLLCVIFGIISISTAVSSYQSGTSFIIIQVASAIIGFMIMMILAVTDYTKLSKITKLIYVFSIMFLICVLIFGTGKEDTGSKSWIRFGPIGIQPSEIVKIGFIITLSNMCVNYSDKINKPVNVLKLCIHALILMGLIMLQPDFGTTMVFIVIFCAILFSANISYKYILSAILSVSALIPIVWNFFLQEYQKNRIRVLFNPESDPLNAGYHVMQSKIAVGSGGAFGKGIGMGTQTQLDYLPAKHTDFIYSVIGEEMGLIGCVVVLTLLVALILRCIYIAKNTEDKFGSYICIGIASMIFAHTFENIGMCIGIMPVTGIPLPFFSYGGSSMLTNMLAIGLILSISKSIKKPNIKEISN